MIKFRKIKQSNNIKRSCYKQKNKKTVLAK